MRTIYYLVSELDTNDGAGIFRVANEVYRAIAGQPPCGWRIVPVRCDGDGTFRFAKEFSERLSKTTAEGATEEEARLMPVDIILSVDLVYNYQPAHKRALEQFRAIGGGVFFVVYDLIPLRYPHWFSDKVLHTSDDTYLAIFRRWFDFIGRTATGILAISRVVQDDVASYLESHGASSRESPLLGYFHMGTNHALVPTKRATDETERAVTGLLGERKSFLLVGTLEPRKGHLLAIDAFERLWAQGCDCNLVFVGKRGSTTLFSGDVNAIVRRIEGHPEWGRRLLWLNSIPDHMLVSLYRNCTALLQLSLSEGFGLPMIEAASLHLPLIVRDIPVNREICGTHAVYFTGEAGDDLAEVISKWIEDEALGAIPDVRSMRFLTWAESAKNLLTVVGRMHNLNFEW